MRLPKDVAEMKTRFEHARLLYKKRDQMADLSQEMYKMDKGRKSGYLSSENISWRSKVGGSYWHVSNKAHNAMDLLTAVLAGHPPYYQVTQPGNVVAAVGARAERFISGVWRINSRRQQIDLIHDVVFRTALHGGAGIRIYWDALPKQPQVINIPDPDFPDDMAQQGAQPPEEWTVLTYEDRDFPICVEIVDITSLYPLGKGKLGRPFDEIFHVSSKTPMEVLSDWSDVEGVDVSELESMPVDAQYNSVFDFIEWWGEDKNNQVFHALIYRDKFLQRPTVIDYPGIPYILTTYKRFMNTDKGYERIPFLFPSFWSHDKKEYLASRQWRLIDIYSNLPPIHKGDTPLEGVEGDWGGILNLRPDEAFGFPDWPGVPPDVHKKLSELDDEISEATFSPMMFGQMSANVSGYALSQQIGSDTIRLDTPRMNLELSLAAAGDFIFSLLRKFSMTTRLGVVSQVQSQRVTAVLSGEESRGLVVECFVKPKQTTDELRKAAIGAQLASMQSSPISVYRILQDYFDIPQPEEEIDRKLAEEAQADPLVKLMAVHSVLVSHNSPYASVIQKKLDEVLMATMTQPGQGAGTGGESPVEGQQSGLDMLGMGLPQNAIGNPPNAFTENPTMEQPDVGTIATGGPVG